MKKLIMACGIAAMAMGMMSCSGSGSKPTNFVDSVAYYMGSDMGVYCNNTIARMPEEMKEKFDKQAFVDGMKAVLLSDTTKSSYLDGIQMGMNLLQNVMRLKDSGIDVNTQMMYARIKKFTLMDSISAADSDSLSAVMQKLNMQIQNVMREAQQRKQMEQIKAQEELAKKNEAAGAEYMEGVKAADKDVKTTESGLSYKVVNQGEGALPTDNDRVKVIYTGRLVDGTVFDDSKGEAREFRVNGVVAGFKEGLKMMNKGSKYTLYIPAELGYGMQAPQNIGPGSTLVFDVEVVEVIPGK
ncbi:MAG: FKBP-type peptidyl-prolyl cis-trans isomerase [Paramuribaculum sp.]|nr:FKBP-type peptidyl-prolyl cis-trans isomerase [Paramuribaculum sp.]